MEGIVIYASSCQRLRTPSIAPASNRLLSIPWKPATNVRNPVPRLIHNWTTIRTDMMLFWSISQPIGS